MSFLLPEHLKEIYEASLRTGLNKIRKQNYLLKQLRKQVLINYNYIIDQTIDLLTDFLFIYLGPLKANKCM